MSKAVLVMDMPESCYKCEMRIIENDTLRGICAFCGVKHKEVPLGNKGERVPWCPLKPLPKKQELTFHEPGQDAITMGWNACIEEIEGNLK